MKMKKCKDCRKEFKPFNSLTPRCFDCATAWALDKGRKRLEKQRELEERKERAKLKQRKDKLKTRADWLADCQVAFNAYIRERDNGNPCISCGNPNPKRINAGHYRSVGSTKGTLLRFSEDNCHLQCVHCNHYKSGNQAQYRERLIEKIGLERVEILEGPQEMVKLSIEEIKDLTKHYKEKLKGLKNDRGN